MAERTFVCPKDYPMQITRYDLSLQSVQTVLVHGNAQILSVTTKNWPHDFSIHVLQNTSVRSREVLIECFPNEEKLPLDIDRRFIGTVPINNGWVHVFERK